MTDGDTIEARAEQYGSSEPIQKWEPDDDREFLGSVDLDNAIYNPDLGVFLVNLTRSKFDSGEGLGQQFTFPAVADGDYEPESGAHEVVVDVEKMAPPERASNFESALYDLLESLDGVRTTNHGGSDD